MNTNRCLINIFITIMDKINVYYLNRLVNQEFPSAFKEIISRLEGEEFSVEDVQQAFDYLKTQVGELKDIKSNTALHPLTKVIRNSTDERHQHLLSLKGRVLYSLKSPMASERQAADVLYTWLNRERDSLSSKNAVRQTQTVDRMQDDLATSENLNDALGTLGMSGIMDSLRATTSSILRNRSTRKDDKMKGRKKTNELRRNAYKALQTFITAIEQAIVLGKGDQVDNVRYLMEIDEVISEYNAAHERRVTRVKNAAQKAEDENQNAAPENGEQDGGGDKTMNLKGGKPAMAGGMKTFGAKALNGMDLQNGTTNGSLDGKLAMNGSGTNGAATDGAKEKDVDSLTSNGGGVNNTFLDTQHDATEKHEGARNDDSDQNRGMNNLDS